MKKKILQLMFRLKVFDALYYARSKHLTVLCYHRITDPDHSEFQTFKPNVSATPAAFAAQIDFLQRRFNLITLPQLIAWLTGQANLPARPALITFDDGYRDNFTHAYPVLSAKQAPAVIFLTTNFVGQDTPFHWDLAAYCFYHTTQTAVDLPITGPQQWEDRIQQQAVLKDWMEALKKLPDSEKRQAIARLPNLLNVSIPHDVLAGMSLSWDQVRKMVQNGISMGAHTMNHPILTRISPEAARQELVGSKRRIEEEIGQEVTSVAYTNGGPADFNAAIQVSAQELGFNTGFSLIAGPVALKTVRRDPLAINRTFMSHKDTLPRFAAKVSGILKH